MAEEFLRELTHDDQIFEDQWSKTCDNLHKLSQHFEEENVDVPKAKVKVLDALIDFILAEPIDGEKPIQTKFIFVELIVKDCSRDEIPSVDELVRLVRRIIDQKTIFNRWFLHLIEQFHFKFRLCEKLRTSQKFDLIQLYLESYLKHDFVDEEAKDNDVVEHWKQYFYQRIFSPLSCDSNKLNDEETVAAIRPTFQRIFR